MWGTVPAKAYTFSPTGGVIKAISTAFIVIIPNQIGSKPKENIIGKKYAYH